MEKIKLKPELKLEREVEIKQEKIFNYAVISYGCDNLWFELFTKKGWDLLGKDLSKEPNQEVAWVQLLESVPDSERIQFFDIQKFFNFLTTNNITIIDSCENQIK